MSTSNNNIAGKVVVITGASSGIGYATALALSRAGARIAAGARRTDKLELLRAEIGRTVADCSEIEDEVRHLIGVLSGS